MLFRSVTLPVCWFDESKCKDGIEALRQYQREWSEDMRMFADHPKHDWTSQAADAFRYLSLVWKELKTPEPTKQPRYDLDRSFNELRDAVSRRRLQEDI